MTGQGGPVISRDVSTLSRQPHDLVIVGAGIHGVALALESTARGLRPLVVDQGDFGAMTSSSTLRILHGGFRYLQSLDLRRFFRSVEQRRWWFANFPGLVSPLRCLMPLYGDGLRKPGVLRAALVLNDLLSRSRNDGVDPAGHIPGGRVVGAAEARRRFPGCRVDGLKGAALWSDGSMDDAPRLLVEMLRWMVAGGGAALNYAGVEDIRVIDGCIAGVALKDELTGDVYDVKTETVLDATGPWSGRLAEGLGIETPAHHRLALAFNVLIRKPLPARAAVAVASGGGQPLRFLRPWGDLTFAGTFHAEWPQGPLPESPPEPPNPLVVRFLEEINHAVPGFGATLEDVVRVFAGLLPAGADGVEPLHKPLVTDHGKAGGPRGLVAVVGEKYTTAPALARSVLDGVFGPSTGGHGPRMRARRPTLRPTALVSPPPDGGDVEHVLRAHLQTLRQIVQEESVQRAEDLLIRRLDWSMADVDLDEAVAAVYRLGLIPSAAHSPGTPPHS